jgi:hypothetical protein
LTEKIVAEENFVVQNDAYKRESQGKHEETLENKSDEHLGGLLDGDESHDKG